MDWQSKFNVWGVRATERPAIFIPKGALTHHLGEEVALPSAIVRFPKKRVEVIAYRHISS